MIIGTVILIVLAVSSPETYASSHIRGGTDTAGDVIITRPAGGGTGSNQIRGSTDTAGDVTPTGNNACPEGRYCLLAPLPIGTGGGNTESIAVNDFGGYANGIITLIIGFSGVLAVLMFMIGGFTYMTGESIGGKAEGRKTMTNAIFGFVLLLASYIILNTINPDLLNLNLDIQKVQNAGPSTSERETPYTKGDDLTTPRGDKGANDIKAKQIFGDKFSVNKADCINPAQTNCTSLDNIDKNTVDAIKSLQEDCDSKFGARCAVTLTGGDEAGHKENGAHPVGKAVDTSKFGVWNEYLTDATKNLTPTKIDEGLLYSTKSPNGQNIRVIKEANTWHIDTLTTSN